MKKISLIAACCSFALAAWGQPVFQPTGKSVADLHETRTDETVVTAGADINKDGVKDLVIALDGYYSGSNFAFYFGDGNGGYKLFREYETEMYGSKCGITVTDKGVVRIQCDGDAGSDIFLFRWQDGDFRLIGGKKDRHASEHYDESYNYLTGKMIRTDGEGSSRKAVTTDMPKQPAINFGWIPLYYDMLGYLLETPAEDDYIMTPDDLLAMGIFRVMQANEMLFWHFADWENPYHDLCPDGEEGENFWYANDEHMSPGSYNAWSSLSMEKLADGSYLIDLTESFYDRSYEALFDEDLSNVDEVMEENESEEEITRSRWIFKDGQFIPQEIPEPVAFNAYRQMMLAQAREYEDSDITIDFTTEAPKGSTVYYSESTDDIEGYYEERTMDCLPLSDGGWLAIYTWAGAAEGEPTSYQSKAFTFIDGQLTPAQEFLPVPKDLDGFLNPDACDGQDELVAKLKADYAERPQDWLVYLCNSTTQTMVIEYRPTDPYFAEYEKHVWSDDCWDLLIRLGDLPTYKWDGKQFVK